MNALDILRQIAALSDDSVLVSLFTTPAREHIITLIGDNLFWYERSCVFARRTLQSRSDANWAVIYYALVAAATTPEAHELWKCGLKDYNSLLVLMELYGEPNVATTSELADDPEFWEKIESPRVLRYLYDIRVLRYSPICIMRTIDHSVRYDQLGILTTLLDIAGGYNIGTRQLNNSLSVAVHNGSYQVAEFLLSETVPSEANTKLLIEAAVKKGNQRMVELLRSTTGY